MKAIRYAKAVVRRLLDSLYCKRLKSKKRIGTADNWFVLTDSIRNGIVYSGGVGKDITFEMALAVEYGATIHLFDPSPTGIQTIESLNLPSKIRFHPVGLAGSDRFAQFAPPLKKEEGSYRVGGGGINFKCRSLSSVLRENNHKSLDLLKIDIEGFEYDVIDDIISNKLDIRQIAVEFHDFYADIPRSKTLRAVRLLRANGYELFHKRGHDYSFVKRPA